MRPMHRALLAGVLAAAGLPGCSLPTHVNKLCCLAEGAFPTPRHTAAISADGTMAVTDEYGEPVPFEVRPITFEVDPFDLTD